MIVAIAAVLASCGPSETATAPSAAPAPALTLAQKQALLATLPAAYAAADLENGRRQFGICRSCHTLPEGGPSLVGPNLWGVFGRAAGTTPGFDYSPALRGSGIIWSAETLEPWLENPRAHVPGTRMVFAGLRDPARRRDVIAYLRTESSPAPAP